MKRRIISLSLILTLLLTIAFAETAYAKTLKFAGRYQNSSGKVLMKKYKKAKKDQYGKKVGYAKFYGFKDSRKNTKIVIYDWGKNVYADRAGFILIKVKKKSIVVKGGPMDFANNKQISLAGKYKLKKRL